MGENFSSPRLSKTSIKVICVTNFLVYFMCQVSEHKFSRYEILSFGRPWSPAPFGSTLGQAILMREVLLPKLKSNANKAVSPAPSDPRNQS